MTEIIIGGAVILTAVLLKAALCLKPIRRDYTVSTDKITSTITAVHISDLHESLFGKNQHKLIKMVRDAKPDVIFITGDMVEDEKPYPPDKPMMADDNNARMFFEAASKIAPCYMVFGNHEANIPGTERLFSEIADTGVCLLHRHGTSAENMSFQLDINGEQVFLAGAYDPYFDRACPHRNSLSERIAEDASRENPIICAWRDRLRREYSFVADKECLTVLLSHRPEEYQLYRELGFDVAFSGHAHGGQWRLPPFINGVYAPNQGLFPRHAGGCYRFERFVHIVSRGLSKKRMVRIFNRPEVCVVKFLAK